MMPAPRRGHPASVAGIATFFAAMYFVQGAGDPVSGLIAQPIRALLRSWGESPTAIGGFMALLSLPWMLKPLFALIADFVPLAGTHRRHYLLLSSSCAAIGLAVLYCLPLPAGARGLLFVCLLLPTIGIAFGDVLVDALMVETGQPRGLTGRLQAVQWAAVYSAMLLSGAAGGWLSAHRRSDQALLICAVLWAGSFLLAWRYAHDTPRAGDDFKTTATALRRALRQRSLGILALFMFVWSFNPSWESVQYLHITGTLAFGEQVYGLSSSAFALGCIVASIAYAGYCRHLALASLLQLAVLAGVLGYGVYLYLASPTMLYGVAFVAGCANMTGTLVQLDLVARRVPLPLAATAFAAFMALTNLSSALAEAGGSYAYEQLGALFGPFAAYQAIVIASALIAAGSALLVPRLGRELQSN